MKARSLAYTVAGLLTLIGVMGLLIELNKRRFSSVNFYGYVLAALFIMCGALTFVGAWFRYRGGSWSFVGMLLVAAGIAGVTAAMQLGPHLLSPRVLNWRVTALWGVGLYCLAWGHLRSRKTKKPKNEKDD